jgi:class 3 adenylate cyclase
MLLAPFILRRNRADERQYLCSLASGRRRATSETRKFAAILAAEVVGFSRLVGADEDRTLAQLRQRSLYRARGVCGRR